MQEINSKCTNAVRVMLKNKDLIHYELQNSNDNSYLFDINYGNCYGTLHFRIDTVSQEIVQAVLNLNRGKIITLSNDTNLSKLCTYILVQHVRKEGING